MSFSVSSLRYISSHLNIAFWIVSTIRHALDDAPPRSMIRTRLAHDMNILSQHLALLSTLFLYEFQGKMANACNHVSLDRSSRRATHLTLPPKRYTRGVCGNWRQRAEVTCIALFGLPSASKICIITASSPSPTGTCFLSFSFSPFTGLSGVNLFPIFKESID